jgi:hypothetical protein
VGLAEEDFGGRDIDGDTNVNMNVGIHLPTRLPFQAYEVRELYHCFVYDLNPGL